MKNPKNQKLLCVFIFSILFNCLLVRGQQFLTTVNGWNAYVHLPNDYNSTSISYPTIIFFPGLGEVGTNANLVIANGPGAYITQGWNGNVLIGTDSVKFIVISLRPPAAYPTENLMDVRIQTLKSTYRIDSHKLYMTGLSHGGWCATTYVTGDPYGGPYAYAGQVAAIVNVEGVTPDDNTPYPDLWDNYAAVQGRLACFEQILDNRDMQTYCNRMNQARPGSAIYTQTSFGNGGHCCWASFYGGGGTQPSLFMLDGISQDIYHWLARQQLPSGTPSNLPPSANAGPDQTINLPISVATLTGVGTDPDGIITSYQWTKITGPSSSGTITSATNAVTTVTGLLQGVYKYELRVTDDSGAVAKDTMQITVNVANIPPVANAGADQTITLPTNTVSLTGSGSDADGSVASYQWTKISGPPTFTIVAPTQAQTAVNNLVQGTISFN